MQLLLGMYPQLVMAGIADVSHVSYAFGRLVESLGYKNVSDFVFTPDIIKQAQMMGVPPQMLMMMKYAQETGDVPPGLVQGIQGMMNQQAVQQAQVNNAVNGGQKKPEPKQPFNPDPGAPENAGLST